MIPSYRFRFLFCLVSILVWSAPLTPRAARFEPRFESRRGGPAVPDRREQATTATAAAAPESPSVTHHTLNLGGRTLEYTATAGLLPIKDDAGKPEANIFYIAYTLGRGPADPHRPLMFAFNGGPGASALWLHVGGLGPKRVAMDGDGTILSRESQLVDNESTWLDLSDLVFVDPVGTGYSRAAPGVEPRRFFEVNEDVRTAARFIRLYLTQNQRWLSPLYLAGESYGTTRVAALTGRLQSDLGIYPRGVILISTVLDFQTISAGGENDLPYVVGLPSCTAAAWYHKKLPPALMGDLDKTLAEVQTWAIDEYLPALARGDALPKADEERIADRLAAYTGLSRTFLLNNRLRVSTMKFSRELLRDEGRFLGFMDGRVRGVATSRASEYEPFDPSFFLAIGPFVAAFNDYVRRDLHFESALNYEYLSNEAHGAWRYGAEGHYLDVSDSLSQALAANKHLKVFNAAGLFDLTTPFFAQRYSLNHLGLEESLRGNITFATYRSGHQIYTSLDALKQLKDDAAKFMK